MDALAFLNPIKSDFVAEVNEYNRQQREERLAEENMLAVIQATLITERTILMLNTAAKVIEDQSRLAEIRARAKAARAEADHHIRNHFHSSAGA